MLEALGTITRLDWELQEEEPVTINRVLGDPQICPRLEHIRVHGVHEADLIDLVQSRIRTGAPLKTVEVNTRDWPAFSTSTKAELSKVLENFGSYVDEIESDSDTSTSDLDSDSGDWTDSDLSVTDGIIMDMREDSDDEGTDEDNGDSVEPESDLDGDP
ncbi:hypothetical protein OPQ81_008840 [Rhizoctonia solani]|nr:hypothetical protein OPQ81_008840 [Rhizoctonia solani]